MGTAQRHQQTFGLRGEKLNMGLERGGVGREGEREGEREGGAEGARMVTVGRMLGEMGATWQGD